MKEQRKIVLGGETVSYTLERKAVKISICVYDRIPGCPFLRRSMWRCPRWSVY